MDKMELANRTLLEAIETRDLAMVKKLVAENPSWLQENGMYGKSVLHDAAMWGANEICEYFISQGVPLDVDGVTLTPLSEAVRCGNVDTARLLLEHGADPNRCDRVLFTVSRDPEGRGRELFQLLHQYGIELNRVFAMFGDATHAMSALDYAGSGPFAEIFRNAGAKTAFEILAANPNTPIEGVDSQP
jgi:hypothetical protein